MTISTKVYTIYRYGRLTLVNSNRGESVIASAIILLVEERHTSFCSVERMKEGRPDQSECLPTKSASISVDT